MTWQLVLAAFFAGKKSTASVHLPTLAMFTTKLSFNSEDSKRTQLFTFESINLTTKTAQTSANSTVFRPLPEAWSWQTEWKTTVDWDVGSKWTNQKLTRLKFRIEMNQSNTCCVSWEVLLVSWKTNGALKVHRMAGPLKIKGRGSVQWIHEFFILSSVEKFFWRLSFTEYL